MPLQRLQFKPGVVRDLTAYTTEGGWYDCNLVRFRLGFPETVGGWQRYADAQFVGSCRALHSWSTLDNFTLLGVGTHIKYYIEEGGTLNDVTPLRRSETLNGPFAATDGSAVLTVTDVGHGAAEGDYVTFSAAASLGGNVVADELNQEFVIASVIDDDNYTVTLAVTANASDTGNGGATVDADYQLNVGSDTQVGGVGWGTGAWGEDAWGEPSGTPVSANLRIWSHDNFGEDLIYGVRNGGIYYWDRTNGLSTRGVTLASLSGDSTTPTLALQVLVSDTDRHVIAFGANQGGSTAQDPLLIRFSSQEAPLVWTPSETNTAGDLPLGSGSRIVRALETKREILVWTDSTLYSMQFIGPPFTFGVQQVSSGVTINNYNAVAAVEDTVFWMGLDVFFIYSGQTQELPCAVKDFVFTDFNRGQRQKVFAAVNTEFGEVTWFYPSSASEENNRYVTYNYTAQLWYFGALARTAWIDRDLRAFPVAAGTDGYLYDHEIGQDDGSTTPASPLNAYIESSPVAIGEGDDFMFVRRVIPDVTFVESSNDPLMTLTLIAQDYPGSPRGPNQDAPTQRTAPIPVEQFTEQVHVRMRARTVRLRAESNRVGTRWVLGTPRIDVQPSGRR